MGVVAVYTLLLCSVVVAFLLSLRRVQKRWRQVAIVLSLSNLRSRLRSRPTWSEDDELLFQNETNKLAKMGVDLAPFGIVVKEVRSSPPQVTLH